MPQIRRIRIVNISYNNGKRLIPDELFDLTDEEGREGLNTLISLINGGGKSVLVQLMMQPVLPRAHASSRRIEEFFTRSGDHGFILLEWMLDNSETRLMTGIAIAAADSSEESRGRNIKYYTFCSTYTQDSSKYSIIKLELSGAEGSRFVPTEYDYVRKLATRSSGELRCFSDRENSEWKEVLEKEYGILQEQWRTLTEKLNSSENGMTGYFEKFKTSDQLIDQLLIPAIEAHLSQTDSAGESELSTMMLGYLKQYRNYEKRIHERDVCQHFNEAMAEQQKSVQELQNAEDLHKHAVSDLFGFQAAVAAESASLQEHISALTLQQEESKKALRQIEWEEASEQYWKAKAEAEQASKAYQKAQIETSVCDESIKAYKQNSRRMQAAKYAAKYGSAENEAAAITAQIQEKEQDSDAQHLTVLGSSIRRILETELPAFEKTVIQQQQNAQDAIIAFQQARQQEKESEQAAQDARTVFDRKEGSLTQYQQDTDLLVLDLQLDMHRNFTGCYSSDELKKIASAKVAEYRAVTDEKEKLDAQLQAIIEQIAIIPDERAEYKSLLKANQEQLGLLQTELDNYLEAEDKLRAIFALHSLDYTQRFTSTATEYITGKLREAESEMRECERRLEQKTEEYAAANAGSLHVPQTVLNWLDQTSVQYQTCEHYILKCALTAEQIETLLQEYPAVAYGILVSEREKQILLKAEHPDWLPAVLPIYTYDEINAILQHDIAKNNLLAYYAKGYFDDHSGFIDILLLEKEEISRQIDSIKERIVKLNSELQTVSGFQYDERWHLRKEQEIEKIKAEIQKNEQLLLGLKKESEELNRQRETLTAQIEENRRLINNLIRFQEDLQKLESRLFEEEKLYQAFESARIRFEKRSVELQAAHQVTVECSKNKTATESALQRSTELLSAMQQAQTETQAYTSSTSIEGDWRSLFQQFQTLCQTQDESIGILRVKLEAAQKEMQSAQAELRKTDCHPEEYADIVYSEQSETEIADELQRLEEEQKRLHKAETDCAECNGKAQYALEHATHTLSTYGEPLAQQHISGDYPKRRATVIEIIEKLKSRIEETANRHNALDTMSGRIDDNLREMKTPKIVSQICLDGDYKLQWKLLCTKESDLRNQLNALHASELEQLQNLLKRFQGEAEEKAIGVMIGLMQQNGSQSDRYYMLDSFITESVNSTKLRAGQIDAELNDFDNTKQDLVRQCVLQGQQIYQGLQTIMKKSRIQTYEDTRRDMLKMDLPKEIDEALAAYEITTEIDRTAQEIMAKLEQGELTEAELKQKAEDVVSSRHLLRKYIRKENIELQAYKVDANRSHAEYRRWKDIPRTNSGAEKFLVYFAVIVLLMDYSSNEAGIRNADHTNVLILDNPFAVITSAHVLKPMFGMAKQFRIQLICLSDITKCDITNCFDLHIKAAVRQNTLSDISILSHEENEQIEHGFYRAKQLELS